MPFAVIGSNTVISVNGKKVRARAYPWGTVDIENEKFSDFNHLRDVLIRYILTPSTACVAEGYLFCAGTSTTTRYRAKVTVVALLIPCSSSLLTG